MNELPSITTGSYTSTGVSTGQLFGAFGGQQQPLNTRAAESMLQQLQATTKETYTMRIVKVFIADPNENIPLEKRVIHSGEEKLTDLTDQELFFEVPIAELLKAHNGLRSKTIDKKQSEKFGRDIYLEPVRIKDLKMVVVAIAQF